MLLTDLSVRSLKAPESGAKTYFDDQIKGFGVRISYRGTKTYVLLHGQDRRRVKIGRVGGMKLKEAREAAKRILERLRTKLIQINIGPVPILMITWRECDIGMAQSQARHPWARQNRDGHRMAGRVPE